MDTKSVVDSALILWDKHNATRGKLQNQTLFFFILKYYKNFHQPAARLIQKQSSKYKEKADFCMWVSNVIGQGAASALVQKPEHSKGKKTQKSKPQITKILMVCDCIHKEKLDQLKELYEGKSLLWLPDTILTSAEIRNQSKQTSVSNGKGHAAHVIGLAVGVRLLATLPKEQQLDWKDLEDILNHGDNLQLASPDDNLGLHRVVDNIILKAIRGELVDICGSKFHFKDHEGCPVEKQHARFLQIREFVQESQERTLPADGDSADASAYKRKCRFFYDGLLRTLTQVG